VTIPQMGDFRSFPPPASTWGPPQGPKFASPSTDAGGAPSRKALRSGSRAWRATALIALVSATVLGTLGAVLLIHPRIKIVTKTVTHTVFQPSYITRDVPVQPPLQWQIGACVQNVSGGSTTQLVSCSGPYDWVIVSKSTTTDGCLNYTTDGGWTTRHEYTAASDGSGYFCMVP